MKDSGVYKCEQVFDLEFAYGHVLETLHMWFCV